MTDPYPKPPTLLSLAQKVEQVRQEMAEVQKRFHQDHNRYTTALNQYLRDLPEEAVGVFIEHAHHNSEALRRLTDWLVREGLDWTVLSRSSWMQPSDPSNPSHLPYPLLTVNMSSNPDVFEVTARVRRIYHQYPSAYQPPEWFVELRDPLLSERGSYGVWFTDDTARLVNGQERVLLDNTTLPEVLKHVWYHWYDNSERFYDDQR